MNQTKALKKPKTSITIDECIDLVGELYWLRLAASGHKKVVSAIRILADNHDLGELDPSFVLNTAEKRLQTRTATEWATLNPALSRCCDSLRKRAPIAMSAMAVLRARVQPVADRLKLDELEITLLLIAAVAKAYRPLEKLCSLINVRYLRDVAAILTPLIEDDRPGLIDILGGTSKLHSCGLLSRAETPCDLNDFLEVSSDFRVSLVSAKPLSDSIMERTFVRASPCRVAEDFAHLRSEIAMIEAVLRSSDGHGHVLLAGPPGVGKTELARVIAANLGWAACEVRSTDDSDAPADRADRFTHYALGCRLLGSVANTLVIFDEAEDVFVGDHWMHISNRENRHKAWTNRLLESVTVPTIWISNSLEHIDPAYVRRFDYVLDMQTPPRSVRLRLTHEATQGQDVSNALVERVAESEAFTPADADRVRRILPRAVAQGIGVDAALRQLVTCRPGGVSRAELTQRRGVALPYRLDWINVAADVTALVDGLRARGHGTLVFSGPPGTGKTELARHIALSLDRPLRTKKASDLLSMWLGGTEQNIARCFEAAERDHAVLLLDEADSLLRDRRMAEKSWEVTQVNELLAQLDGYAGIAILTTNFTDALDRALLRRMDVKLDFGYLKPGDAKAAFAAALHVAGIDATPDDARLADRVADLRELAMGDFAAALRGIGILSKKPRAEDIVTALHAEVRAKGGDGCKIGFAAN